MSLFARLKSDGTAQGTTLDAEPRTIRGEELWWDVGATSSAGIPVTESTALQFAAHLATLITLATDVAVLPLRVYQRQSDGGRREAREHPADSLLSWTPDGETTPMAFRQAWMGHALQYGTGFAEIERRGRGTPVALHLLDPASTTRRTSADGRGGYDLGGGRWLPATNVLRLAGFSFDGLCGYNLVRLMRQALGLGLAAETFGADYFANGSEPGGVIKHPKVLKPEARNNLRQSFEEKHRGPGNRHRVALLEEGAEWVQTAIEPEKSQLLETRKFQVLEAIRPWRLPPHKAGDYSQAHLSNIEASNLDYLMTALMGWLTAIEQECDLKLFSPAEHAAGYYVEHNVNALLRGDIESRFRAYETGVRNGWFSRNDVRKRENLNPIPEDKGGDLYTVQSQNIPLEQVADPPAPAPAPAPAPTPGQPPPPAPRHNPHHGHDGKFTRPPIEIESEAVKLVKRLSELFTQVEDTEEP